MMTFDIQSLPSRQLHLRPGSPMNGVLEGRETLAGGATTGSRDTPTLFFRRAPAGAREASARLTSAMMPGVIGRFSRPSWALPSSTMGHHADPVVAPPAHLSRASGTLTETSSTNGAASGLRQPCCRFGVGAALLPGLDSRLHAELSDSVTHSRSTPAGLAPKSGSRLPPSMYAACLAVTMLTLSACGKKEATEPTAAAPQPAAMSDAKIDAAITEALTPLAPPTPTKSDLQAGLEAQAEDIIAKYPDKNAQDLLNVPEVNEALKAGLTKLGKDKKLQDQINNSASMVAKMQGLSGEPGSVGLDLDIKGYDHDRKSRMLQAVMSEDPKQIVRFITEEVGEAAPELIYGGAKRASNGVSLKETEPPNPK